jgi:hypothetical protein
LFEAEDYQYVTVNETPDADDLTPEKFSSVQKHRYVKKI